MKKIVFSVVVFLFACGIFLPFFSNFFIEFFLNGFPQSSQSILGLICCLVNKNYLNCRSGLVLLCFFFNSLYLLITFFFVLHVSIFTCDF